MLEFREQNFDFMTHIGKNIIATARLDTCDFNALRAGIEDDEYGLKDFKYKDGDVVLDLGAHLGGEAMLLAVINPKIRILSFEPLPENFKLLNQNIKLNGFTNIETFPMAVCGKSGFLDIYYGDAKTEFGRHHYFTGAPIVNPEREHVTVVSMTLEEIFRTQKIEHCKILKMDIETSEIDVLETCPPEILAKIDYIVGEHHYIKREELFKKTKGLFDDIPCRYQTNDGIGHWRWRNKNVKEF